jgi:propanediol dehydratase large subunit
MAQRSCTDYQMFSNPYTPVIVHNVEFSTDDDNPWSLAIVSSLYVVIGVKVGVVSGRKQESQGLRW